MMDRNQNNPQPHLRLIVGDHVFSVSQLGPAFCEIHQPIDHPPCQALLVIHRDGKPQHLLVELTEGIAQHRSQTPLRQIPL